MKLVSFVLLLTFTFSCAWNQKELEKLEEFKGGQGNDILDQLDLSSEVADKFKVDDDKAKSEEKLKAKKDTKKKEKKKKKVVKKIKPKSKLPKDYPKEYVGFDKKSKPLWKSHNAHVFVGEKSVYDVTYGGITIGKVALGVSPHTTIQGRDVYHFFGRLKSAPFYSYVYELDDKIESFVEKTDFLPIKYSMLQQESKKTVNDLQLFDKEELKSYFRYKKVKKGEASFKKKDVFIPAFYHDSYSSMYFMRGLPLKIGDKYQFPIVTRGNLWLMNVDVLGKEDIETKIGKRRAIKVRIVTKYTGELVKKGGVIFLWFEDNDRRPMLQFKADVKLGSISGEIVSYQR
jgi:hypothetical protein